MISPPYVSHLAFQIRPSTTGPSPDDSDQHDDDRNDQNDQYNNNCPQQVIPFFLIAYASCSTPGH